jgi:hypothetical protein
LGQASAVLFACGAGMLSGGQGGRGDDVHVCMYADAYGTCGV